MKRFALILTVLLSAVSLAGDDLIATVAYTGTAACSAQLRGKTKYAVRCTTDCHVMVSTDGSANTATTSSVLVPAGKLYDSPTTATQRYICVIQSVASGNAYIYHFRGATE